MATNESLWIEARAARALAEWKAFFAEQVSVHAKELAKKEKSPSVVTLDHYRQAAAVVAQMLVTVVKESESSHDRQEAA